MKLAQFNSILTKTYSKVEQKLRSLASADKSLRKKIFIFALFITFVWGLLLRTTRVLHDAGWYGDVSRDLLIAKHISEFKEFINAAPYNGSSFKVFKNSPLYFYLVASLWTLGRSHLGTVMVHATISSINVIVIGVIVYKLLKNKVWALVASFIAAKAEILVYFSTTIFQPHLLPLVSNLAILFWIIAHQNKSLKHLYASMFFLLLGLNIHYSQMLLLPGFGLLIFMTLKSIHKRRKSLAAIIFFLCSQVAVVSIWLYFVLDKNLSQKLTLFYKDRGQSITKTALKAVKHHLPRAVFHVIPDNATTIAFWLLILLTIATLIIFKKYKKVTRSTKLLVLTFALAIITLFFYQGEVKHYYLTPLYSLLIICLTIAWSKSGKLLSILGLLLIFFYQPIFYKNTLQLIAKPVYQEDSTKTITQQIAHNIWQDYQIHNKNQNTTFDIFHNWSVNASIDKTSIWFVLEESIGEHLITVQTFPKFDSYSLVPRNQNIDTIYLLCIQPLNERTDCLQSQNISDYENWNADAQTLKASQKSKIFTTSDKTFVYAIYRCVISQ
jgi:hypothetical protein